MEFEKEVFMKLLLIKIKSCSECPYCFLKNDWDNYYRCRKYDYMIERPNEIPKWCPLDDASSKREGIKDNEK
jgi:hypothetical protein